MVRKGNQSVQADAHIVSPKLGQALAKSGQQIFNILENTQDGFIALNQQWEFIYLNQSIERLFNIDRFSLFGKNIWRTFPQLKGSKFYTESTHASRSQTVRSFTELYPALNRRYEVTVYPSQDILVIYFRDMTGQQRTQSIQHDVVSYGEKSNPHVYHKQDMNFDQLRGILLENELHHALAKKQFRVYYQPQIDTTTRSICGMEALIRWQHPSLGLVPPNEFLPLTEANGLIRSIGEWVLQTACQQAKVWQQQGFSPIQVSVNFSAIQFQQDHLADMVQQILDHTRLAPSQLRVEITESAMMASLEHTAQILNQLRSLGIQIVIDDFGTCYSSLQYLKDFPVDMIKIDRSFIKDIQNRYKDQEIVRAVIELAHRLGVKVCAEGVEDEDQFNLLKNLGCDEAQGFLFSRPIPPEQIRQLLHTR
ncbi:EAL domain-containing protein (putative c-di-GMP-specific phosphodiesterase class I) [Caldalkalibacillus uzonensis]|uniref:EAL domain-containing protein (Putative c-di-GMP-specific phosphodiesterase class I) n=1 Tax=Caldalkalibacillus uzonensis TaxID=353224 RepID=A0ABU0CU18_9BACI|nr:EAL domain-containing protein [Caldalkalibacillus uzonensis]MDQ0339923.1 EAL domain-containing protein (putative c-di-GMP-specific phosphodiesterase class I) [Caldalkalibacillus uzonensis]